MSEAETQTMSSLWGGDIGTTPALVSLTWPDLIWRQSEQLLSSFSPSVFLAWFRSCITKRYRHNTAGRRSTTKENRHEKRKYTVCLNFIYINVNTKLKRIQLLVIMIGHYGCCVLSTIIRLNQFCIKQNRIMFFSANIMGTIANISLLHQLPY